MLYNRNVSEFWYRAGVNHLGEEVYAHADSEELLTGEELITAKKAYWRTKVGKVELFGYVYSGTPALPEYYGLEEKLDVHALRQSVKTAWPPPGGCFGGPGFRPTGRLPRDPEFYFNPRPYGIVTGRLPSNTGPSNYPGYAKGHEDTTFVMPDFAELESRVLALMIAAVEEGDEAAEKQVEEMFKDAQCRYCGKTREKGCGDLLRVRLGFSIPSAGQQKLKDLAERWQSGTDGLSPTSRGLGLDVDIGEVSLGPWEFCKLGQAPELPDFKPDSKWEGLKAGDLRVTAGPSNPSNFLIQSEMSKLTPEQFKKWREIWAEISEEHPSHTIIVNGSIVLIFEKNDSMLSYEKLVELAKLPEGSKPTIVFSNADQEKSEGTLLPGQSVKTKQRTVFDVVFTNNS